MMKVKLRQFVRYSNKVELFEELNIDGKTCEVLVIEYDYRNLSEEAIEILERTSKSKSIEEYLTHEIFIGNFPSYQRIYDYIDSDDFEKNVEEKFKDFIETLEQQEVQK